MKKLVVTLALFASSLSTPAYAHFNLTAPTPNAATNPPDGGMGSPPCGIGTASGVVTPAQGGHPITIKIDEFIGHTGFYRVALALNSPTELPLDNVVKDSKGNILPPSGKPSGTSASAAFENPAVFPVLQDDLFPHVASPTDQTFQGDVMLPNVNCDKCTLQVLEFMQDHPFNFASPPDTGPGGGYFYRHCADLKITADPSLPIFSPGSGGSSGAAGSAGSAGASAAGSGGVANAGGVSAGGAGGQSSSSAGAPPAAGATAAGGSGVTGSAGTGGSATDMPTSADSGGCSCSLGARSRAAGALASLLIGFFALGWRRARRR
jgi:hypothetical protein